MYHHAFGHRRCTRRQRFRGFLHLNQTHATVRRDGKLLVITEVRYIDAQTMRSLNNHAAFRGFYRNTVYGKFNHLTTFASSLQIFGHHELTVLNVMKEFVTKVLNKTTYVHGSRVYQVTNGTPHQVKGYKNGIATCNESD